jgi:hypothetical protein
MATLRAIAPIFGVRDVDNVIRFGWPLRER